jgi:hypothetical protein
LYPQFDGDPFQCMLNIKPMRDVCWVRSYFQLRSYCLVCL